MEAAMIRIAMHDTVVAFGERSRVLRTRRVGDKVEALEEPLGYWLTLKSGISYALGPDLHPMLFSPGDTIRIVIEKDTP
jgi:S1-C subfamily serine protease